MQVDLEERRFTACMHLECVRQRPFRESLGSHLWLMVKLDCQDMRPCATHSSQVVQYVPLFLHLCIFILTVSQVEQASGVLLLGVVGGLRGSVFCSVKL